MQHINRFVDLPAQAVRLIGDQRAGGGIDKASALPGRQTVNVVRIARVRERQFAQVGQVDRLERGQLSDRHRRAAIDRDDGFGLNARAVRQNAEGRQRQITSRQRRQHQAKQREAAEFGMQPLRRRAGDRTQDRAPAAQSRRQHHRTGNRQHDHGQRAEAGGRAPGVAHQQGAVQIGDNAHEARRRIRRRRQSGLGIDQIGRRLVAIEIIDDDRTGGGLHDAVDVAMVRRHRAGQLRHIDLSGLRQRAAGPLHHRIERQDGAGDGQHGDQHRGDQAGQRVNLAKHGGTPDCPVTCRR